MTTYTDVVLYVLSLWFMKMRCGSHAFLGPQYIINISKVETLHAAFSTKCNFCWHDFSEAPSATGAAPNELSPIAGGGEEIGRRSPAVVIHNTISNGHRLTCDALGALSKRRQDYVRFALFRISSTLPDQVGAEPTEAGKMFPLRSSERV